MAPFVAKAEIWGPPAGGYHGQALTNEGVLLTWGQNSSGQLGDGTTVSHAFPVRVLSDVRAMAAGWWRGAASRWTAESYPPPPYIYPEALKPQIEWRI